jgi:hypothetical protein
VTHDGFIEDLAWKYVAWFCNQTAAVHAPSVEARRTLREKGVAPEKILLSNPPPAAARDAAPEGGAAEPPAAQRGSRAAGR